LLQTS